MDAVTTDVSKRRTAREASSARIKVCLHILREVHTDVRALRAAATLAEEGFAVSIVDLECERGRPIEEAMGNVQLQHMYIPQWRTSRRFEPWFFFIVVMTFFRSIWRLLQTRADVYHASELTALPASYIAATLRRKPLIFEAYELHWPMPYTGVAFWRALGALFMRSLAILLPRCAGVITTSPLYAREMQKQLGVSGITVLRNIPDYQPAPQSDRLRQLLNLQPDTRIALYQGNIQSNRRLDRLVRAAAFLEPNIVVVFMGKVAGTLQSELEALIASEGVADRVKIIPPVPHKDLLYWTASADLGLLILPPDFSLSIRYCLPNKLFEYLMAGLPVLSTPLDAVAELIKTYDVGHVVPSLEPAEIGVAINAMLADAAALARMHDNALAAAQRDLYWEKEKEQLIGLYRGILTRRLPLLKYPYRNRKAIYASADIDVPQHNS